MAGPHNEFVMTCCGRLAYYMNIKMNFFIPDTESYVVDPSGVKFPKTAMPSGVKGVRFSCVT